MKKKTTAKRGVKFVEGQARLYTDEATAIRAHGLAVCKGFCYSTLVTDRRGKTFTLFVTNTR